MGRAPIGGGRFGHSRRCLLHAAQSQRHHTPKERRHRDRRTHLRSAYPYDEAAEPSLFAKFEPGTQILPAAFQTVPHYRATPVDIVLDKDVAVTMRDGATIYVDVLRPSGDEKVPVIVAWSPYGKGAGTHPKYRDLYTLLGIDIGTLSGLAKFEGPDPAYWCAQGYAVSNPDARGGYESDGDGVMCGQQDGEDGHDVIEWLAA